jgi:hypothetical protein
VAYAVSPRFDALERQADYRTVAATFRDADVDEDVTDCIRGEVGELVDAFDALSTCLGLGMYSGQCLWDELHAVLDARSSDDTEGLIATLSRVDGRRRGAITIASLRCRGVPPTMVVCIMEGLHLDMRDDVFGRPGGPASRPEGRQRIVELSAACDPERAG